MTSAPAVGFEYRPSRWIPRLLTTVGALAALAIAMCGFALWAKVLLVLGVIAACHRAWRGLRVPIHAVGWSPRSGWSTRGVDGADLPATLLGHRVLGRVILLRLEGPRCGKMSLWLMPDNTDADIRRRLRMRLAAIKTPSQEPLA